LPVPMQMIALKDLTQK